MKVGFICGFAFFVVAFVLLIGAHGDGHGPAFIDYFAALVDFPVDLLGLSRKGAVFPATAFWGVVAGVLMFIALQTRDAFRCRVWQEEVQLSDGTVLEVHRKVRFEKTRGGAASQTRGDGWMAYGEDLSFVDPGTGRVVEWSGHRRIAALLNQIDGQYVVAAAQPRCSSEDRGQPLWMVYVFTPTGWKTGKMSGLTNDRTPNLALDAGNYNKTKGWTRLTIGQKSRLDAESTVSRQLMTIDLNDTTTRCP